jgi:virginiamycin B lyase
MKKFVFAVVAIIIAGTQFLAAQAQTQDALTGRITSAEEGAMEGVLVSAKKTGSTITISVVSDAQGPRMHPRVNRTISMTSSRIPKTTSISLTFVNSTSDASTPRPARSSC